MKQAVSDRAAEIEALFLLECSKYGWESAIPFHHSHPYDAVIRRTTEEGWKTVQVKRAYRYTRKNGYSYTKVSIRRGNPKNKTGIRAYKEGDFDLLFVSDGISMWLVPWEIIKDKKSEVQIGSKRYDQYRL